MDLQRILNLKHEEILGLDIGSSAVKIVKLRQDDSGYAVTAWGIVEVPESYDEMVSDMGRDDFDRNMIKAIRECFALTKLRTKNRLRNKLVVCGVSGPEVAVRDFDLKSVSDDEIESSILLEAEQVCPFSADQAAVDYQLISKNDNSAKGILVAATNTLIDRKIKLAQQAGLKCVMMDIDGLALLNCFHRLSTNDEVSGSAVLNIGGSHTTLAIKSESGWPFIRDTDRAGNAILEKISAEKNITPPQVKEMLFGDSPDNDIEINQSLEKASEELMADVNETIRFYAAQEKSSPVEKIFVCGGFALAKGFIEILQRRLGTQVLLWNPFENVRCELSKHHNDVCKVEGPAMAVAAGLAMRSIENQVSCEKNN